MKYNPNFLQIGAGWLVRNVEAILIMCTPLLAPLPSMFAAIRALERGGWVYANLIGVIIEMMGLAAGAFMGLVEGHNQRHPDRQVSVWWGRGLFAFYFIVIEALILSSDPNIVSALLPGLTLVGSVIVGFRDLMRRADDQAKALEGKQDVAAAIEQSHVEAEFQLELDIKRQEAEQRLALQRAEAEQKLLIERQRIDAKLRQSVAGNVAESVADKPKLPLSTPENSAATQDRRNTLLMLLQQFGDIGDTAFGEKLNVDRTTVYRDFQALKKAGIVHKNGNGWERNSVEAV